MTVHFVKAGVFPQGMAPSDEKRALEVIEVCGRTAYKSEDKITEDSAKSFVLMLKKHGHLSVLEHSNIVLKIGVGPEGPKGSEVVPPEAFRDSLVKALGSRNGYHRVWPLQGPSAGAFAISGNFRGWIETLRYLGEKEADFHPFFQDHLHRFFPSLFEKTGEAVGEGFSYRVSLIQEDEQLELLRENPQCDLPLFIFKFICDRGITHEVVRHRVLSFTQESTRYVNYGNKGMTLIVPEELEPYYDDDKETFTEKNLLVQNWLTRAATIFEWYQGDLKRGLRPEIARDILPNLLKSEILVSGRWSGWKHFIQLRDSRQAHPRIRFIGKEVRKYFDALGLSCD